MGWDGNPAWKNRADVENGIKDDFGEQMIHSHSVQDGMWALVQNSSGRRIVALFLIERNGKEWMYKAMSEDTLPFYYDCPLDFIEKADKPTSINSVRWRIRVLIGVQSVGDAKEREKARNMEEALLLSISSFGKDATRIIEGA